MVDEVALRALATAHNLDTEFWDWQGQHRLIEADALIAILAALGVAANTDEAIAQSLQRVHNERWLQILPPTIVMRQSWTPWIAVHLPHGRQAGLILELEDGQQIEIAQIDNWVDPHTVEGQLIGEATFELPADLPIGWHRAHAQIDGKWAATAALIVTPQKLELPTGLNEPVWGLMEQIYQVCTEESWGIGDLDDLARTASWAGGLGADFCLINPLHAATMSPPIEASPYLPSSRHFANPIYLKIEAVPGFASLPVQTRELASQTQARLLEGFMAGEIDRDRVWAAKTDLLRQIHAQGVSDPDYADYLSTQGQELLDFARWCTLTEAHDTLPAEFAHPQNEAVTQYAAQHQQRVDYYCWLQWLLSKQRAHAQEQAIASGMRIGLINDLAVGVHPEGAEAWAWQDCLLHGVHVGAPPDQFNQLGQNWHQPPWSPRRLAELGYEPFRKLVRSMLTDCGAVRIDHIIGMFRLWLVPEGFQADQGAYLRYDNEALLGILLLEAQRAEVMVIGEDLGVVEEGARTRLAQRGILGTSVLWFEWRGDQPLPPEDYRRLCLATLTTHDLPPTAGYLDLIHVKIRARLGLLTRPVAIEEAAAAATVDQLRRALLHRYQLATDADDDALTAALHGWLAATPCLLRGVALADLAGDHRPINQPGTSHEYPNWRLPLAGPNGQPLTLETLMKSPRVTRLLEAFHPLKPSVGP